jgi:hypothetical protein
MRAHRYLTVVYYTKIVQSAVYMCRLAQIANSTHGTATNSYNCINIVSVSSLGQLTNARALHIDNVSRVRVRITGGKPGHHWSCEDHTIHVVRVSHIDTIKREILPTKIISSLICYPSGPPITCY